jgi:hypothetical protein
VSAVAPTIAPQLDELRVPMESLTLYPRNPRRGVTDRIRESLAFHGQYRPIVVNERSREILAGNHTYLAARELGWDEIAVTYVDVDDEQAARIVLVDNRTADLGVYDDLELVELLQSLPSVDGTAYTGDDLDALLASLPTSEPSDLDDGEARDEIEHAYGVYTSEQLIDAAFAHYREHGFPLRAYPLHQCMSEINQLAATDDDALHRTRVAYGVADTYHPHRWSATVLGKRTALQTFDDDRTLRIALQHALTYNIALSDAGIRGVCSLTRGAQAVSNFRPGFALMLMRRYAPPDAVMLDTSTGYGGRLTAFLASHCSRYIGVDPATETHAGNERLVRDLCPPSKSVELHCMPAEDVDAKPLRATCDFAFTSPPYFAKERYNEETTQSWMRYDTSEAWRVGFLLPMLRLQFAALRSGAYNVVNIADVIIGSESVPLEQWTLDAAAEVGFEITQVDRFPLARRFGPQSDEIAEEPVIVMRKR